MGDAMLWDRDVLKVWFADAAERSIKTGAQVALASLGAAVTFGGVDWTIVVPQTGYAMVLSLVMSAASINISDYGTASAISTYKPKHLREG